MTPYYKGETFFESLITLFLCHKKQLQLAYMYVVPTMFNIGGQVEGCIPIEQELYQHSDIQDII